MRYSLQNQRQDGVVRERAFVFQHDLRDVRILAHAMNVTEHEHVVFSRVQKSAFVDP